MDLGSSNRFVSINWPGLINSKPFLVGGGNVWEADCCCSSSIWMSIIICHGFLEALLDRQAGQDTGFSLRVVFPKLGLLNALLPVTHKLIFGFF